MEWARLTINLEPELAEKAKARAKSQRRSFTAYVLTLIENDIAAGPLYPERAPQELAVAEGSTAVPVMSEQELIRQIANRKREQAARVAQVNPSTHATRK